MSPNPPAVRRPLTEATRAIIRELLSRSAALTGTPELTCWLVNEAHTALDAVLGAGPLAARLEGSYSQPLDSGLVSVVFTTGQSVCRNRVKEDPNHNPLVDKMLGQTTEAMIAVPLRVGMAITGVLSTVHLEPGRSFAAADLREIEFLAACVSRILLADACNEH